MRVVLAGYRVVFNERARAFDRAAADADAEARRKVRTLAGNYQILALEPRLLLPWHNPVWLQYLSHKLGRLLVPYALLAIFFASIVLTGGSGQIFSVYGAALTGQVLFYLLAGRWRAARARRAPPRRSVRRQRGGRARPCDASRAGDRVMRIVSRAARVAFTFVMMNYAAVAGLFAAARRRRVWR